MIIVFPAIRSGPACAWSRQRGTVLVFSLVFLLLLTMMAVNGMESAILEQRMAGNMQSADRLFRTAEAGLLHAESWLASRPVLPEASEDGSTGVWKQLPVDIESWEDWGVAIESMPAELVPDGTAVPRHVIEEHTFPWAGVSCAWYRITVRATDRSVGTMVQLQSLYAIALDVDCTAGRKSWSQLE